jgi:anion-transporting  ArsA/GET3 family ATPase
VSPPLDGLLAHNRLLITAGSGGVGKTTMAAALAVRAALQGHRVAVLTIDPARRLANALGLPAMSSRLQRVPPSVFHRAGLNDAGEMWAMMLDTKSTGDQMVQRFAPDAKTAGDILKNRYYEYFSTSLAGTQEYMAVEQVRALVLEGGFDLVVLDTPPAVNALNFLDAPERLLEGLESPPMQMLRNDGGGGLMTRLANRGKGLVLRGFNKLTGGPFLAELTEFLTVFGSILDALKTASEAVHALLRAPSTQFLLVTTPARSNVDEALRFRRELATRGLTFGGFFLNRVHQALPSVTAKAETIAAALAESPFRDDPLALRLDVAGALLAGLQAHNRLARMDRSVVERLALVDGATIFQIPLHTGEIRDIDGLAAVARSVTG